MVRVTRPRFFSNTMPILIDDDRHHAGVAIFRRKGDQCKSACQMSIDEIVLDAAGGVPSLPRQDSVVVPLIWCLPSGAWLAIALGFSGGDEWAERALFDALRRLPIESVMLSF